MSTDEFDLEAWISSARMPERSVTVYGRGDLLADHQAAEETLRARKAADDRLVGDGGRQGLADQVRELEAQIRASQRTFRVRGLTAAEQKAAQDAAKAEQGDDADITAHWLAASTISPVMTLEQVRAVRGKIGEGQYVDWFNASIKATNERVTVPFSPAASAYLSPKGS